MADQETITSEPQSCEPRSVEAQSGRRDQNRDRYAGGATDEGADAAGASPGVEARSRLLLWLLPACALGISFVLANTHWHGPPCLFKATLHIPCPGCGLTRSFNALWHGDLITAFRFHPLGLPLFTFFAVYVLSTLLRNRVAPARVINTRLTAFLQNERTWKAATWLMLGVWTVRLCLMFAGNRYFMW